MSPGDTLKQCGQGAHAIIQAVSRGPANEGVCVVAGGVEEGVRDPVHGIIGRSLSLLLLLRSFEERTSALASAGRSAALLSHIMY